MYPGTALMLLQKKKRIFSKMINTVVLPIGNTNTVVLPTTEELQ
jgi:hypothetical protein